MYWKTTMTALLATIAVCVPSFSFGADDHPGKALFVKAKCNTCHGIESQSIEAARGEDKAPDMSNAASLIPSAEWAKKFVLREEAKEGKKHRKPYKGTEKDLEQIIDWLLTLRTS